MLLKISPNLALVPREKNVRMFPSIRHCHRPIVRMSIPKTFEEKIALSIFVTFSLMTVLELFSLMNKTTMEERERLQIGTREMK